MIRGGTRQDGSSGAREGLTNWRQLLSCRKELFAYLTWYIALVKMQSYCVAQSYSFETTPPKPTAPLTREGEGGRGGRGGGGGGISNTHLFSAATYLLHRFLLLHDLLGPPILVWSLIHPKSSFGSRQMGSSINDGGMVMGCPAL